MKTNSQISLEDLANLATTASKFAHQAFFHAALALEWKQDETPLTVADRGVRDIVAEFMTNHYPLIPVVGEEGQLGQRTGDSEEVWMLVDEVDGTWAYMLGVPVFSTMIAVMRGNLPIMAAIADPIGKRLYLAERGKGATLNGLPIRVTSKEEMPKIPSVGFVSWPKRNMLGDMLVPGMVKDVVVGIHEMGCEPVSMVTIGYLDAMVSSGKLQGTVFPGATLHDTAAGHLIVEEAGGQVTNLRGEALSYEGTHVFGHIFSCGGDFHQKLVDLVTSSLNS